MAGLGERGRKRAEKTLFSKTEEPGKPGEETSSEQAKAKTVSKTFHFSQEMADQLRVYAFENRRKEVDIVREALYDFLQRASKGGA